MTQNAQAQAMLGIAITNHSRVSQSKDMQVVLEETEPCPLGKHLTDQNRGLSHGCGGAHVGHASLFSSAHTRTADAKKEDGVHVDQLLAWSPRTEDHS